MRPHRLLSAIAVVAVLLLVSGAAAAQGQERWFHIHVTEGGDDPVEVLVNLPLSLIESAMRIVPDEVHAEIEAELNDVGIDMEALRQFWEDARGLEDATFVTVESETETVRVAKRGDYLIAETSETKEGGAEVNMRLPFDVLSALFSEQNHVDLPAALRAIAEQTDGELVTVREGDTFVRIWVDDENEPAA